METLMSISGGHLEDKASGKCQAHSWCTSTVAAVAQLKTLVEDGDGWKAGLSFLCEPSLRGLQLGNML